MKEANCEAWLFANYRHILEEYEKYLSEEEE